MTRFVLFIVAAVLIQNGFAQIRSFEGIIVMQKSYQPYREWMDTEILEQEALEIDRQISQLRTQMDTMALEAREMALEILVELEQKKLGIKSEEEKTIYTLYLKNGFLRVETSAGDINIIRPDKQLIWTLIPYDSTFLEFNLSEQLPFTDFYQPDSLQWPDLPESEALPDSNMVVKTGLQDSIIGIACEQLTITRGLEETECWISTSHSISEIFGPSWHIFALNDLGEPADFQAISELDRLPLLIVDRNLDDQVRTEIVAMKERPVPDFIFQVPEGFRAVALESFFKDNKLTPKFQSR